MIWITILVVAARSQSSSSLTETIIRTTSQQTRSQVRRRIRRKNRNSNNINWEQQRRPPWSSWPRIRWMVWLLLIRRLGAYQKFFKSLFQSHSTSSRAQSINKEKVRYKQQLLEKWKAKWISITSQWCCRIYPSRNQIILIKKLLRLLRQVLVHQQQQRPHQRTLQIISTMKVAQKEEMLLLRLPQINNSWK